MMVTVPPYLKKGDTIGIVCPGGFMPPEKVQACLDVLQHWGYKVKPGATLSTQSDNYFSAPDDERLSDLQGMLDDNEIKAVLCARGGYGTGRIIDRIDFTHFKNTPKWIIGFSDITLLHAQLFAPLYPVSRMIRYRLPVFEYLPKVTAPVIIFHGNTDGVIPYANAKRLKPLLKPGDLFITIEGGSHNDLFAFPEMQHQLDSLLGK